MRGPLAQGFFGAVLFLAVDHDGGLASRAAALLAADFFDFLLPFCFFAVDFRGNAFA